MSDITIERTTQASDQITLSDDERQQCEVWTRVMGYHRPVSSFNRGKQGEYAERTCFTEPDGATA
jgi:anaerobic ribonucleoside-triphosphate reductase